MAENTNEKKLCEQHNMEAYTACEECKKPLCSLCESFDYVEIFPKKVEKVCPECYKKLVQGKIRELIVFGVLGVVLAVVLAALAGPGLIPFGLLAPYAARGLRPKFNTDNNILHFAYIFTVFVYAAIAVIPIIHLVQEIKILKMQKKEIEELQIQ